MMRYYFLQLLFLLFATNAFATNDLFANIQDHMRFLTERDHVLAKNISNADTPKYKPTDLKKLDKSSAATNFMGRKTHHMHFDLNENAPSKNFEMYDAKIDELKPSGNGVNLQDEMLKKAENSMRLQEMTNVYMAAKKMLRTALVGAGR